MKDREKLLQKHAKELAEFDRESALTALLPDWLAPFGPRLHFYPLYGVDVGVSVEHDFYAYGKDKPAPTLDLVRQLAEHFPPVPVVLVRDSCLSFRTRAYVTGLPEEMKERWDSEIDVCPFRVTVDPFQHLTSLIEWPTVIGGTVAEIKVKLAGTDHFGRIDVKYKEFMGGRRVDRCSFTPKPNTHTIYNQDGRPVAQLESPIKWARGGEDTPNNFTMYYVPLGEDATTAADLVHTLTQPA